jgi:hypothetical protein
MKIFRNNSTAFILLSITVLIMLLVNLMLDKHPVLDLLKYLESEKYFWTVPSTFFFLFMIWLFDRGMKRKIINERVEIFKATIRTIQDILQNSSSSMQLLILDMKDEKVNEEIIKRAENNIEELKSVVKALAAVDPTNIKLKELNDNLSIIKLHE